MIVQPFELTKVLSKYRQREDVEGEAEDLRGEHEPVPGADGECDHDEFGEDERRERDGDDVDELVLEQDERSVHDHSALVDADQHPHEERAEVERATLKTRSNINQTFCQVPENPLSHSLTFISSLYSSG